MKKLLLLLTLISTVTGIAQTSCATAVTLTANGVTNVPTITGTYQLACNNVNGELASGPLGMWYQFTPTSNGQVTVSSNLSQNVAPFSDDTRVSVYTGSCAALTCVDGSDDVSATNYLTTLNFSVLSGNTYYIQWDNRWSAAGFAFEFTFTAVSCLPVSTINLPTNISTTGVTLNWDAAAGNPAEYQVEYGPLGFLQGTGTIVTVATNSASLTQLSTSTPYEFYVRSKCNATDFSAWSAISSFTTAKLCPQSFGFENNSELIGFSTFGNGAYGLSANAPTLAQAGNFYWIFNTNATAASNNWLFTAPFSLQANEAVTVTFWVRCTTVRSLRFTVGNANSAAAQTTEIWANPAINNPNYVQYTVTYTPTAAGIYYFGWNDVSTAQAVATLRLDSINFSSVLSTKSFENIGLSVYPNPVDDSFMIDNMESLDIKSLSIFDINGRTVKNINVNSIGNEINISDLNSGIYFLNIDTENGTATKKIIKK